MWIWGWFIVIPVALADIYLHNPRGSNNRLNEKSAVRNNANRLFDSENNDRGGYNVGDAGAQAATKEEDQYIMKYFQSSSMKNNLKGEGQSLLNIEWTQQHGCNPGTDTSPHRKNCNIILQYQCQNLDDQVDDLDRLRDGLKTKTQPHNIMEALTENKEAMLKRKTGIVDKTLGLHESWESYDNCLMRERNKNLFTADQTLRNNKFGYSSAIFTRQNANGARHGYECPEERDYYPYWHPSRWIDIVLFAQSPMCKYYQTKSHNVKPLHECVEKYADGSRKHWSRWSDKATCIKNNGSWLAFTNYLDKAPEFTEKYNCEYQTKSGLKYVWGLAYDGKDEECLVALDQPDCLEPPWTRTNHLGLGVDAKPLSYTWVLPNFPSGKTKKCILRIRYNISSDDYNPNSTDARHNENKKKGIVSPVRSQPLVDVGERESFRLAMNSANYGRTFQDRSHTFILKPRLSGLEKYRIYNLNVRGKRGNIVQVYPGVEYDYVPTDLSITRNDLIHIQWTGSNTHNNENPGGDGQVGDAGQGTAGTDRNNLVQINDRSQNYPVPFENSTFWTNSEIMWIYHGKNDVSAADLALNLASSGYYRCRFKKSCPNVPENFIFETKQEKLNNLLNNAPASFEGVLLKVKKGTYHYINTRNNNFSNRSQKGTIIITD